jgi:phage FluMu protein Com
MLKKVKTYIGSLFQNKCPKCKSIDLKEIETVAVEKSIRTNSERHHSNQLNELYGTYDGRPSLGDYTTCTIYKTKYLCKKCGHEFSRSY